MDLRRLQSETRAGGQPKYLFFWGHRAEADGRVGKGCLSQWWPSPFVLQGIRYATAEHYMMAEKARLFADAVALEQILAAKSPAAAKKLGRGVRGFDEITWAGARFEIVVRGNQCKFQQHAALADYLLTTGERVIVEASPRDRVWGIGLSASDERARDPHQWRGLNLLGFALMEVRNRLRDTIS